MRREIAGIGIEQLVGYESRECELCGRKGFAIEEPYVNALSVTGSQTRAICEECLINAALAALDGLVEILTA